MHFNIKTLIKITLGFGGHRKSFAEMRQVGPRRGVAQASNAVGTESSMDGTHHVHGGEPRDLGR